MSLTAKTIKDLSTEKSQETEKAERITLALVDKGESMWHSFPWKDTRTNPEKHQTYWAIEFRVVKKMAWGLSTFAQNYAEDNCWLEEAHANEVIKLIRKDVFPLMTREKYAANLQQELFAGKSTMRVV